SSGALVTAFGKQEGGVVALALAKDGKRLATGGKDGTIDIWDLASRRRLRRLRGEDKEKGRPKLAFSPDGDSLICTAPGLQVWDVRTGKKRKQYPPPLASGVHDMDLAPDGKTLVASAYSLVDGKEITVLEVATGKHLFTIPAGADASVV